MGWYQNVSGFRSHATFSASSSSACSLMIPVVAPFDGTVEHRWRLWLMLPLHFWFKAFAHKPDHFPWCHHGKCFRLSIAASSVCRACGERSHQLFFCSFHRSTGLNTQTEELCEPADHRQMFLVPSSSKGPSWARFSPQLHDSDSFSLLVLQVLPKLSLSVLSEVDHLLGNKSCSKKDLRS